MVIGHDDDFSKYESKLRRCNYNMIIFFTLISS